MQFENEYRKFMEEYGRGRKMVLSTSLSDKVTSRMMSIVMIDGKFYFQTDRNFRKYHQICKNPNVALCIDNIQIEGMCREIGHPMDHEEFCRLYRECFKNSYEMYSSLQDERLFVVEPTYIEKWTYIDNKPFVEVFEVEQKRYEINPYVMT